MRIKAIFNENDTRQASYIKYLNRTFPEIINEDNPEMYFVIGGDGAMLHAHTNTLDKTIPYFGKGFGTLNFIMNNYENDFEVLEAMLEDRIIPDIIETSKIKVTIDKVYGSSIEKVAINDIVIGNNIMDWHEFIINNESGSFNEFYLKGMGICLSTPLGSTAFNLNNRGKVLPLDTDIWGMTGIVCDHNINELMTPQKMHITINSLRETPNIYVDGIANTIPLEKGDKITIDKDITSFKLAFIDKKVFFNKRMKLIQKKR